MVEQESDGMAQHLPKRSTSQMPQVARPHPLYGAALRELREDGDYPVAKTAQKRAPLGVRITLLSLVGGCQLDVLSGQLHPKWGRAVVAVCDDQPRGKLGYLWEHGELASVGWSHRKMSYDSRPADPKVHPEAVEGLLEKLLAREGAPAGPRVIRQTAGTPRQEQQPRQCSAAGLLPQGARKADPTWWRWPAVPSRSAWRAARPERP